MNIKASEGRLIVRVVDTHTQSSKGIYLANNSLQWGEVVDLGPEYYRHTPTFDVGNSVAWTPGHGVEFIEGGERYLILNQSDIIAYKE